MINILFVCAGNTCRSVICEYLLKHMVLKNGLINKFNIQSCGIYVSSQQPAAPNAVKVIEPINKDIKNHKTQAISSNLVQKSDYIFALDPFILSYIKQFFSQQSSGHISCINDTGICDPYGSSLEIYQNCAKEIKKSLKSIIIEIIKNENL